MPAGKALDHVSMYGTDLSNEENENMYQMSMNLQTEVITQGVKNSPNSFAQNTSTTNQITKVDLWLYCVPMCGVQQCFIDVQNRCVRATDEQSRLVIETAGQLPATLKDFRMQELALEMQT